MKKFLEMIKKFVLDLLHVSYKKPDTSTVDGFIFKNLSWSLLIDNMATGHFESACAAIDQRAKNTDHIPFKDFFRIVRQSLQVQYQSEDEKPLRMCMKVYGSSRGFDITIFSCSIKKSGKRFFKDKFRWDSYTWKDGYHFMSREEVYRIEDIVSICEGTIWIQCIAECNVH